MSRLTWLPTNLIDRGVYVGVWAMLLVAPFLAMDAAISFMSQILVEPYITWIHLGFEVFIIVVCVCIFVTGWHVLDETRPRASILMALMFLAVGLMTALHLILHSNPALSEGVTGVYFSAHLWESAKFFAAVGILVYLIPMLTGIGVYSESLMFLLLVVALVLVALVTLTIFQLVPVGQEYLSRWLPLILPAIYVSSLFLALSGLSKLDRRQSSRLVMAIALLLVGEMFVQPDVASRDLFNVLGLGYTAVAYMFLYRSTLLGSIRLPVLALRMACHDLAHHMTQLNDLLKSAPDGIVGADIEGKITYVNPKMTQMFGYTEHELIGQSIEILIPQSLRNTHASLRDKFSQQPHGRPMSSAKGLTGLTKDGLEIPVDIALGVHSIGGVTHFTAFIREVSERQKLEHEMLRRANNDALTGLPNRTLLQERLKQDINKAKVQGNFLALIMVDLDNFKDVNDGWGHSCGDQLLVTVASRVKNLLGEGDMVARFGGDEFVIVVPGLSRPEDCRSIVDKILGALDYVFTNGSVQFKVSASVGVALYPLHADCTEDLLSKADIAMYRSKSFGRGTACYYDEDMRVAQQRMLLLKSRLMFAVENNEFTLHYQPQYRVTDSAIVGLEALLRWHHPEAGWITPDTFIPVAESSGLIIPITEWILQQVFSQIRVWGELGIKQRISVNISALHFRHAKNLCELIDDLLGNSEIDPQLLGLELTESALMDAPEVVASTLREIVNKGCHISIDDFGTGYSSLASLQMYPIHMLKIDRSFMKNIDSDAKNAAIVTGVVNLAASLGLEVLAEGVEKDSQLAVLRRCSCDSIQGWLMAPAMSASDCTRLLTRN